MMILSSFQVMDLEKEKEDMEGVVEKHVEEVRELKTVTEALRNTVSEREQRIKLLESSQEEDRVRSAECSSQLTARASEVATKDANIAEKETKIQELQNVLDSKSKELEEELMKMQNLTKDRDKEKAEKDALQKDIKGQTPRLQVCDVEQRGLSE